MSIKTSCALITGAAGGLGSAIAEAFVASGINVIVADINDDKLHALKEKLGEQCTSISLDVTDEAAWEKAFATAGQQGTPVDIVVNNAGIFRPNIPFEEMPYEVWQQHMRINADGVFLGCKQGILAMKETGGAIVNIGSGMSIKASATSSAYCASKAAVLMTTRTAAASAGQYNIRVNAVLPGAVPTEMLNGNLTEGQSEEDMLAMLRTYSPLGRLATPQDIANAVVFLASAQAQSITGIYLPVDGGNMPGA
ncbi:SDR family oxidoreductase [Alteromonas sp. NFXS44]|uniref:SDR family NAD(P)-dependent oxidoreductase n=1 Tax=Alteromonas sp. NFXS44 TaxID=2818435 RepID=UPI0032DF4F4E